MICGMLDGDAATRDVWAGSHLVLRNTKFCFVVGDSDIKTEARGVCMLSIQDRRPM